MPADVGEMISSELTKNVSRMLLDHGYKPRLPTTSYVRVWKSLLTFWGSLASAYMSPPIQVVTYSIFRRTPTLRSDLH